MPVNTKQVTVAIDRETAFGDGIADFDALTADGGVVALTEIEVSEIRGGQTENLNLKQRPGATRPMIRTILSTATMSFKYYLFGTSGTNAVEGATATAELYDEFPLNAWGGRNLGPAAGIAGGTAANPVVETGEATGTVHEWGFFYDTDVGEGHFRKIVSEAADVLTLVTGHDLPFTPDGGGADIMYATASFYPSWDAITDHTDAGHITHTMFRKGANAVSNFEPRGVRFSLEMEPIEAGVPAQMSVSALVQSFNLPEGITQPTLAQTLEGTFGPVVGAGCATKVYIADVGSALAEVNFWGQITPTFGIEAEQVQGPNGCEGVHGYGVTEGSFDGTKIEMVVPHEDNSFYTDYRGDTAKHMLIQVGTDPQKSWAIYYPSLTFAEEPAFEDVGGREGRRLVFMANESAESITGLTADEADRARAKFELIQVR